MKLEELSPGYREAAEKLRRHLRVLRQEMKTEEDSSRLSRLKLDYLRCTQMYTQCRELAELTARYYERGYCRNGKYTL